MLKLVGTVFLGLFIVLFVLFPLVSLIFKIKYFEVLKMIWDLFLIAFSTTSTETKPPSTDGPHGEIRLSETGRFLRGSFRLVAEL